MRLDLFLKASRLVKRRTVAQELCDGGRVLVNEREAKPSKEVRAGDVLAIRHPSRVIVLEILSIPTSKGRAQADELYRVLSETRLPREDVLWTENPSSQ